MAINSNELQWFRSLVKNNTPTNGGRMSSTQIITGIKNSLFDDISEQDRLAGGTFYYKAFAKNVNTANEILKHAYVHTRSITPAGDRVVLFEGTQFDTQQDVTGGERRYGTGALTTSVTAGDTQCTITLEDGNMDIAEPTGNTLHIRSSTNEEYHYNVTSVKVGFEVTFTLDAGDTFSNNYAIDDAASTVLLKTGELKGHHTTFNVTSANGTFDEANHPPIGDNRGSVADTFTLTFTSATSFDCAGTEEGSLGSGLTTQDFLPINASEGVPYFTIPFAAWGGTFQTGDQIVMAFSPAAIPVWLQLDVPAGTNSYGGNNFMLRFGGQTA